MVQAYKTSDLVEINFANNPGVLVNKQIKDKWEDLSAKLLACDVPITVYDNFCCRVKGKGNYLSEHAFGYALDFNKPTNLDHQGACNPADCDLSPCILQAIKDAGFEWGGAWTNPCDPHHVEWGGGTSNINNVNFCTKPVASGALRGSGSATTSSCELTKYPIDGSSLDKGNEQYKFGCVDANNAIACEKSTGSPTNSGNSFTIDSTNSKLKVECEKRSTSSTPSSSSSPGSDPSSPTTLTQSYYQNGKEIDDVWVKLRPKLKARGLSGEASSNVWDSTTKSWVPFDKVYPAQTKTPYKRPTTDQINIGESIDRISELPSWAKAGLKEAAKSGKEEFLKAVKSLGDLISDATKEISEAVDEESNPLLDALNYIISIFESEEDLSRVEVSGKGRCFSLALSASKSNAESKLIEVNFQGQKVKVHNIVAPLFIKINHEISASTDTAIKSYKFWQDTAGGTFNWRCKLHAPVCDINDRSLHSFGIAIDINPSMNPYSTKVSNIPNGVITIFANNDFSWGGNWATTPDPMHFEWNGNKGDFDGDGNVDNCDPKYLTPASVASTSSATGGAVTGTGPLSKIYNDNKAAIDKAEKDHGVPIDVIVAIIRQETNGKVRDVSPTGAAGIMQLIPATFIDLGGNVEFIGVDVDNDALRAGKSTTTVGDAYKDFMTNGRHWGSCKGKEVSPCNDCQKDTNCDYEKDQRFDPVISINLGAKYLKELYTKNSNDWTAAFKKYHGATGKTNEEKKAAEAANTAYAASVNNYRQRFSEEQTSGGTV